MSTKTTETMTKDTVIATTEHKGQGVHSRRGLLGASVSMIALTAIMPRLAFGQDSDAEPVETQNQVSVPENSPASADFLLEERVLGDINAPVTLIEYSSLTCPHCARFHNDTLPRLKREFIDTGKVKVIYRDFPFDGIGLRASMLARCVPEERYFDFLDVLFKNQQRWSRARDPLAALTTFGTLVGMNANDVQACIDNEELQNAILTRQLEGQERYSIRSTPTFILNNDADRILGAEDFSVFKRKIENLLPEDAS